MQDCYMPSLVGIFRLMRPRIDSRRVWMVVQVKDFNFTFSNDLTLKRLFNRHGLDVACLNSVQATYDTP